MMVGGGGKERAKEEGRNLPTKLGKNEIDNSTLQRLPRHRDIDTDTTMSTRWDDVRSVSETRQ